MEGVRRGELERERVVLEGDRPGLAEDEAAGMERRSTAGITERCQASWSWDSSSDGGLARKRGLRRLFRDGPLGVCP